jgi:hypothetical protein
LEEVIVSAGHKFLMAVNCNTVLIFGDPQGILPAAQASFNHLLNIIIIFIAYQIVDY